MLSIFFSRWGFEILLFVIFSLFLFLTGFHFGEKHVQAKWDSEQVAAAQFTTNLEKKASEKTVQIETQYVDRVQVIHDKAATIIKEVPKYVTVKDDSNCVINHGFVQLYDYSAAVGPVISIAPIGAYEESSGVALSTVAAVTAENHASFAENAEQLTKLQEWVTEQQKIFNGY